MMTDLSSIFETQLWTPASKKQDSYTLERALPGLKSYEMDVGASPGFKVS